MYNLALNAFSAAALTSLMFLSDSPQVICPGGEIGRHKGLKIPRLNGRAGSSPAPGTI